MQSQVVFREHSSFEKHWNNFIAKNSHVSVFYSLRWMQYQQLYSEDKFVKDLSFILLAPGDNPMAICPLYLESYDGVNRFSYRGEFLESLRTPLIDSSWSVMHGKTIEKEAFDIIYRLAIEHQVKKINFLIDPLCTLYLDENFNYLTRNSYLDVSISTQIIDLRKSRESLWMELRKSYKALINKGERTYEVVIMDVNNPDFALHENYRNLHFKAAGRITRPLATFNQQFEMLQKDEAMLLGIKYQGQFVSFSYFVHLNKTAYYASEADDPDVEVPLTYGPLSQWKAMEYYKARGWEYIELDNQQFGPQLFDLPSEKDLSISMFKRGFGGKTFPLFRGVRYLDQDLMKNEIMHQAQSLMNELSQHE
jgi:hypothetical protein